MMSIDEKYMQRCIDLAKLGAGHVAPNPLVGAVLVYNNTIIGEGHHAKYGGPHAEVNCFDSVKPENIDFIPTSTLYVSLEPCAHFGKTPPCADLILKMGVKRVVIGCRDPFEEVNGKGIEKLQQAGIKVIENILGGACRELNKSFFIFHQQKRPLIILKWAQTVDNKIASFGTERLHISSEETNVLVHRWRAETTAILVGTNTALLDNPKLNVRLVKGKHPIRLVIDRQLKIPVTNNIFSEEAPTVVFNELKEVIEGTVRYVQIKNDRSLLEQVMTYCYENKIQSLFVEGGASTLNSFIEAGLWDEARVITNRSLVINKGLNAPSLGRMELMQSIAIGSDQIDYYKHVV